MGLKKLRRERLPVKLQQALCQEPRGRRKLLFAPKVHCDAVDIVKPGSEPERSFLVT